MLLKLRKSLIWYVFIAPTFFLYGLFVAYPTFKTFQLSFFHEVATRQEFVGALHYVRLLSNQVFLAALLNTAFLGIIFLAIIIPLSLVMASLLNNLHVWPNLFKVIYFLPQITSTVAVALVFSMAIFGLEIFVQCLQAFIFTVLTAQYISSAIAEEH